MRLVPRPSLLAACTGAIVVVAAACGGTGDEGARSTLLIPTPTSYVVREPDTTTTSTQAPTTVATRSPSAGGATGVQVADDGGYAVQSGDSVYSIADRFGVDPAALAQFNGWADGVAHAINPGEVIQIPSAATTEQAAVASGTAVSSGDAPDDSTASGAGCEHTIVEGDNPTRVAGQYGISVDELAAANAGNPVWNTFLIGSTLTIPPSGC